MAPVSRALQGRVFDLLRRFQAAPATLRGDVDNVRPEAAAGRPDNSPAYAAKVADGLVQSGFLTPKTQSKQLEDFDFKAKKAEFLGVGAGLAGEEVKSVWSVKEGAIQAGTLHRKKRGFLAKFFGGQELCYVVVNDQDKVVYVFESDVAFGPVDELDVADDTTVEFNEELQHGIKLANAKSTEVFAAESKEKQEEWLNSFINAGAQYREVFNVEDTAKIKSFYELKDFDMAGNEVSMSKYKGKVVLAVNVSSKCGLTPTNYPELQMLYEKYKDEGLEVLAFPCNQFAGQEPGTHEEIMEFVKHCLARSATS
ncbi:unnamed protein product [Phytophthora lilii]|uniref:Glutathione peroxidase n=1 Tax=Phytophthora lilii TaxID=2077276 RepID=A0A9W6XPP1_9STRA|nr:unnamed protein product [Phytophthora lilii]